MATREEIDRFLVSVERRAYRHALFAVREGADALDIVQDAMLRLVERYQARPAVELAPLFHAILQNAIRDHFRRHGVRNRYETALPDLADPDEDPLERLLPAGAAAAGGPAEAAERAQVADLIGRGLARLGARQREAFLLRYWEGLDLAETALRMGCSEGSVKTHCSRATHALADYLSKLGVKP